MYTYTLFLSINLDPPSCGGSLDCREDRHTANRSKASDGQAMGRLAGPELRVTVATRRARDPRTMCIPSRTTGTGRLNVLPPYVRVRFGISRASPRAASARGTSSSPSAMATANSARTLRCCVSLSTLLARSTETERCRGRNYGNKSCQTIIAAPSPLSTLKGSCS